jgi:hypothetical protein
MASTVPSVKIVKRSAYKGGTRQWSNRYQITGGLPSDSTHWHTLFDNIVNAEKAATSPNTTIVEALGYAAGSDVAVDSKNYTTAGTLSPAAGFEHQALQTAALVRWSTAARSVKNHPIYIFKYYHDVFMHILNSSYDGLDANQKTALQTYATAWITGFSDGTVTHKLTSPAGHDATGSLVEEYLTHRDFPYTTSL